MEENLKRLDENNMKGLILDLRDNPGGLLNEGVAVADHFLQKGQAMVSHRGRSSPEKTYVARRGNGSHDYPIVVLVNRFSASAAEIVSGALQDHDRAWILGENTFGKGLVQTVFPLQENTGLALTTAHYLHAQRPPDPARLLPHVLLRLLQPQGPRREEPARREDDR